MTKRALVLGFVVLALVVPTAVARAAMPSADDQVRSSMTRLTRNLDRQLDRHFAHAAEAGGVSRLSAEDEAQLAQGLAEAQALLAELGPQASVRENNAVRMA